MSALYRNYQGQFLFFTHHDQAVRHAAREATHHLQQLLHDAAEHAAHFDDHAGLALAELRVAQVCLRMARICTGHNRVRWIRYADLHLDRAHAMYVDMDHPDAALQAAMCMSTGAISRAMQGDADSYWGIDHVIQLIEFATIECNNELVELLNTAIAECIYHCNSLAAASLAERLCAAYQSNMQSFAQGAFETA